MIRSLTYKLTLIVTFLLIVSNVKAQGTDQSETNKRIDDYLELLKLGYSEIEIFQDLGNVNFLTENYDAAAFWYEKLFNLAQPSTINESYKERYDFAVNVLAKNGTVSNSNKDWVADIKKDYTIKNNNGVLPLDEQKNGIANSDFNPSMSVTQNGKVAFFSQAVKAKPKYGVFSKKEVVHEIYRAENVNGKWKKL